MYHWQQNNYLSEIFSLHGRFTSQRLFIASIGWRLKNWSPKSVAIKPTKTGTKANQRRTGKHRQEHGEQHKGKTRTYNQPLRHRCTGKKSGKGQKEEVISKTVNKPMNGFTVHVNTANVADLQQTEPKNGRKSLMHMSNTIFAPVLCKQKVSLHNWSRQRCCY